MATVMACDGPTCTVTADPDAGKAASWLHSTRGLARFDFHDPACLAEWAKAQPSTSTTEVTGR
jgi:hypothetical protein